MLALSVSILTAQNVSLNWAISEGGASGGSYVESGESIIADSNGNVYVTGEFKGTADFDPGSGIHEITSNGRDMFVQKLDVNGNLVWIKTFSSSGNNKGEAIILDDNGDLYITGYFEGTVDFDPGSGVFNLTTTQNEDVFVLKLDEDGNLIWANHIDGPGLGWGFSIAADELGNVFVAARFFDTADLDPGPGTSYHTSNGSYDACILKLDSNGDLIWVKTFGGDTADYVWSICVDSNNDVYITGYFEYTVDFDPGPGVFNLNANGTTGHEDMFVLKLDSDGNFIWAQNYGSTERDGGRSILTDDFGNIYVTGFYYGTVDFDPGPSTNNLTSNGEWDTFILKLSASGDLVWVKSVGNGSFNRGNSLALDSAGNIYVASYYQGTIDADPGQNVDNLTSYPNSYDVFILKLDNNGNYLWAQSVGGSTGNDEPYSITISDEGSMLVTGYFNGSGDFDPGASTHTLSSNGGHDIFIISLCEDVSASFSHQTNLLEATFSPSIENADSVYWDFGDGDFSNDLNPVHTYDTLGIYQVCLIVKNSCSSDTICESVDVTCNTNFTISVNGSLEFCEGDSVVLGAPTGGASYIWSSGDTTQSISVISAGEYYATVESGGCTLSSDTLTTSVTTVNPVIQTVDNQLVCSGTYSSYQWYQNGQPIAGATSQAYTPQSSGTFYVEVTDDNSCKGTSSLIEFSANIGVDDINEEKPYEIFPNPGFGEISIINHVPFKSLSYEVFDVTGKQMLEGEVNDSKASRVELPHSGAYIIRLNVDGDFYVEKVTVQ